MTVQVDRLLLCVNGMSVLLEEDQMKSSHACWSISHGNNRKLRNLPATLTVVLVKTKAHK